MQINGHDIGVCSWTLRPTGAADLVRRVRLLELGHAQLALTPLVMLDERSRRRELDVLRESGLTFTAGMINFAGEDYSTLATTRQTCGYVPDDLWAERRKLSSDATAVAKQLGLAIITTHVGFAPPPGKPGRDLIVARVREVAAMMADAGIGLFLETGQESVAELLGFVEELPMPTVGINFDPANVILYGAGDPIPAVKTLGPWIRHVHVKDAIASQSPGREWGKEVVFGTGQVGAARFLGALRAIGYAGPLVIEREGGDQPAEDARAAIAALRQT